MALTVLDAGVVIAVLDADDTHHDAARKAVAAWIDLGTRLMMPSSAYAEALVGPIRHGRGQLVDDFVDSVSIEIVAATRETCRRAAELRAEFGARLPLPDALVIATAIVVKANELATTDAGWPALPVEVTLI